MQWARLNIFQRLTREWDAIHPYNAAQAMRLIGAAPSIDRLTDTWDETLRELGLGRVRFAGEWYRHETLNGELTRREPIIEVPRATTLDRFMTDQLNRPFDATTPLRPFALHESNAHVLGVVYHHWTADSASIRIVLREWFRRLHDPARARRDNLSFPTRGYWSHFGPSRGGKWELLDGTLAATRWSLRLKQARRVEVTEFHQFATSFQAHALPEGLLKRLLPVARNASATLNDLLLATLAQVTDALVPVKRTSRRRDLALGTIVDLRGDDPALRDAFGLFLGFTSMICREKCVHDFDALLASIARQNRHHRDAATARASMVRMSLALGAHRIFSRRKLLTWYRKRVPLAGGISNVNLNRDWPAEYHPNPLLDYIRVSPCGPMMPLVFTPTTLGDGMNFGLTCRDSVIPPDRATQIAEMFKSRLNDIAAPAQL